MQKRRHEGRRPTKQASRPPGARAGGWPSLRTSIKTVGVTVAGLSMLPQPIAVNSFCGFPSNVASLVVSAVHQVTRWWVQRQQEIFWRRRVLT